MLGLLVRFQVKSCWFRCSVTNFAYYFSASNWIWECFQHWFLYNYYNYFENAVTTPRACSCSESCEPFLTGIVAYDLHVIYLISLHHSWNLDAMLFKSHSNPRKFKGESMIITFDSFLKLLFPLGCILFIIKFVRLFTNDCIINIKKNNNNYIWGVFGCETCTLSTSSTCKPTLTSCKLRPDFTSQARDVLNCQYGDIIFTVECLQSS